MKLTPEEQNWLDGFFDLIMVEGSAAISAIDGMVQIADDVWITEQRAEEIIEWAI